jgi:AraC family transcriptional regulator, regulatory protein of adaptative response / methylated-DNA-[protein]-cysteine methyltransferase
MTFGQSALSRAPGYGSCDNGAMTAAPHLDDDAAWAAVLRRDRTLDGRFVTGVLTTGIYCRPSCAARHPKRENVRFFASGVEAAATGLRACLRCKPDEVARDAEAVSQAIALIDGAESRPSLDMLAEAVGYSPFHFHRLFKRATGVTPADYARARRAGAMEQSLEREARVTDAIYDAGYSGPSRFYADAAKRLGMTPSAWRNGGAGVTVRWTIADTALGPMLLAATERGICRLSFDEGEAALRARFPNATIVEAGEALTELVEGAIAAVERPAQMPELPLDVQGTAFQQAVWRELSRIPAGETLSYAALAARAGKPRAVRAAGTACGANQVAVLIPCHRARRGDGSLGGYAYGLDRKVELLKRESGG